MTIDYYEENTDSWMQDTAGIDMTPLYDRFLPLVRPSGSLLDAGGGPGRDAREFMDRGYKVTAFDASSRMVEIASERMGQPALKMRFEGMSFRDEFDGIWASASLLHVPRAEMPGVLERFVRALKPGGIWYLSFKHGETERVEGGRLFNDQTESMLEKQLGQFGELEAIEMWRTADQRPGRLNETWLNCTVRRVVGPI